MKTVATNLSIPAYGSVTKIKIIFKTYQIHDKYMQALLDKDYIM